MTQQELDRRIGMPNIDQEWAQFEKEVIGTEKRKQVPFWRIGTRKAAAIAGIIFCISVASIATAIIMPSSTAKLAAILIPQDNDEPIHTLVEEVPSYPGGIEALQKHITQNLKRPQEVQTYQVEGRVIVQFVVEKDGRCTNFKVLKDVDTHRKPIKRNIQATGAPQERNYITMSEFEAARKVCRDEALRVCRTMPRWTAGKIKGQAVRSQFTLPIVFKID
ncbi:MAG: hypothetical protein Q4F47_03710 [Bacteroidaceae bacterium]|nr:hypothetical protein [Bacteroidaceae bacterium]